jgi:hypothetical protein
MAGEVGRCLTREAAATAQRRSPSAPLRIVWYRNNRDALGYFITFNFDAIILPSDVPLHELPEGVRSKWGAVYCSFSRGAELNAHQLETLFLEFARIMSWEARLDP